MNNLKKIFIAFSLVMFISTVAISQIACTHLKCLNNFSFNVSAGSGSMWTDVNSAKQVTLGTIGISYKLCSKISLGVSLLGTNNAEGNDNEELNDGEENGDNQDGDNIEQEDNNNECICGNICGSVMLNASYFPLAKHTFFVQPNLGYSIENNSMAYSIYSGWNQNLYKGIALTGGVRYFGNITGGNNPSIKAEVGLSWNL
jgi:hypothetical protein